MLFDDHDRPAGEALRSSPVAKAQPSPAARRKAKTKRTDDGLPVHSFRSLLADLADMSRVGLLSHRERSYRISA
jgi:hypothetical protein